MFGGRFIIFLFLGIFTTFFFVFSSAEKILVLPIIGRGSQFIMAESLTRKLLERGHEVTYLIGDDYFNYTKKGSNGIKTTAKIEFYPSGRSPEGLGFQDLLNEVMELSLASKVVEATSKMLFSVPEFFITDCRNILDNIELVQKLKEREFDIIVCNYVSLCSLYLGEILSKPNIAFFTGTYVGNMLQTVNLPTNPSYVPSISTKFSPENLVHFSARIKNILVTNILNELTNVFMIAKYNRAKAGIPGSVYDSIANSEVVLVNGDFAYEYPRPIMAITTSVGGITVNPAKNLSKEFEDFINLANDGIIVVSFGSYLSMNDKEKCQIMSNAFARLPQRVIWKVSKDLLDNISENVMLVDWLPQNDLLAHPKTKALVYHGGQNGLFEAIYHGVPIVGVPFYGDQFDNLAKIENKGMGIVISYTNLTSDALYEAFQTILYEKSYKENALRLSAIHRDQPLPAPDRAAFWIETVMRYGGQDLKSNQTLNTIQYFCLDILTFCGIFAGLFIILIQKITSKLFKIFFL